MAKKPFGHNSGNNSDPAGSADAKARLRSYIERIERLEEEKAGIAEDIKDVYAEAGAVGFDTKTMRGIVKERRLTQAQRDERDALLDIYKAALGMLGDTPLGEAAVKRLSKKAPAPGEPKDGAAPDAGASPQMPDQPDEDDVESTSTSSVPKLPKDPLSAAEAINAARIEGRDAAALGHQVTTNPYPAHDPRRAAWDEGWCGGSGSDGMDIPEAWRRTKKPKKGAPDQPPPGSEPDDKGGPGGSE